MVSGCGVISYNGFNLYFPNQCFHVFIGHWYIFFREDTQGIHIL